MTVEHFDSWYAAMSPESPRDQLWQRMLGLPPEFVSSSLLPLSGLEEIVAELRLGPNSILLDLACGRGGYGMWAARETGCRLVGVDFSGVAVADATTRIPAFGLDGRAEFRVGDLVATGLPDDTVDAVVCVDAVQFATHPTAACREMLRVVRPGGRVALTSWHPIDRNDERLPARLREMDLDTSLRDAGFADVSVQERPVWTAVERRLWDAVMATDPGEDEALADAREEAERVSGVVLDGSRRVLALGRRP